MSPVQAAVVPDRPFPGIEAFSYSDHAVFFARDEEAGKLLRSATVYRGVLVYGASGAGKSSLINAGFLPRAIAEGFMPDRIRLQPRAGQEIIVERIPVNPDGNAPYLPSSFASEEDTASRRVLSIAEFRAKVLAVRPDNGFPVLIFDQFEEFISLFEEAPSGEAFQAARQVQKDLLDLLVWLHRDADLHVKLIFVFREDYLAKLGKLFNRCPDLRDIFLHLTAPRASALEQIILGPFRRFPEHFPYEFPERLAKRLQFAFEDRSDSAELNLSEVQIACRRLWLSVDQEGEFARKGLQGLLEDYLAESLRGLPDDLREPAVALLSRMVTEAGLRNVISEDDLIARTENEEGFRREKLQKALAALVANTRLVCGERCADVVFYEIVSEFLVPWIGRQKALRHARAQRRRWIAVAAVFLAIALGSLGATIWVLQKRTEAALARDEVRSARAEAGVARDARLRSEAEAAAAAAAKTAALNDAEEMRKALANVRPQQILEKEVARLSADAAGLRAENTRFVQNARAADAVIAKQRQELEALRNRPLVLPNSTLPGPLTPPLAVLSRLLGGTLRAGELTVFTGGPFDAGITCFVMDSDAGSPVDEAIVVIATTTERDTWQRNMHQAESHLRGASKRLFSDLRNADSAKRRTAIENLRNRLVSELRGDLPNIHGIHITTGNKFSSGGRARVMTFSLNNADYEARIESRPQNQFEISVYKTR